MADTNVTVLRHRAKTSAERMRRLRERRRSEPDVTVTPVTVTDAPVTNSVTPAVTSLDTVTMCGLAGRVGSGAASPSELELAGRLIVALVRRLPAGAVIEIEGERPSAGHVNFCESI